MCEWDLNVYFVGWAKDCVWDEPLEVSWYVACDASWQNHYPCAFGFGNGCGSGFGNGTGLSACTLQPLGALCT